MLLIHFAFEFHPEHRFPLAYFIQSSASADETRKRLCMCRVNAPQSPDAARPQPNYDSHKKPLRKLGTVKK